MKECTRRGPGHGCRWNGVLMLLLCGMASCRPAAPAPSPLPASSIRAVSLAPSLTEMVCALDAAPLLVGRTTVCDYPPGLVKDIPVIGGFGDPSIEQLVAAKPTLILHSDLADATLIRRLTQMGLHTEAIHCAVLDDIPIALVHLGRLLGRDAQARALADPLTQRIRELRASASQATHRPRVFIEIWNDPLNTAGKNSFLSELVCLAGGRNVGDEVARDYFQVDPEWIVARDPEVILCFYMTSSSSPRQLVLQRSGWSSLAAVKNRRVYDGFDNNILLRPGPRVLEGIAALRKAIQGEP